MSLTAPLTGPLTAPLTGPLDGADAGFNPLSLSPLVYFDTLGGSMLDSGGTAASHGDTVATLTDLGANGDDATQSTDSLRPVALTETGLYLPGVANKYASIPDGTEHRLADGVVLEFAFAVPDWQPAGDSNVLDWGYVSINKGWVIRLRSSGSLQISIAGGGSNTNGTIGDCSAFTNGATKYVRITFDITGNSFDSEISDDGVSWSAWNTGVSIANPTLVDGASVFLMTASTNSPVVLKYYKKTDSGVDVVDIDFTNPSDAHGATSITAETGQPVTINKSGDDPATLLRYPVARFDGSDDYLSGTFGSTLTGGWMFAVFEVLGSGGESEGTIFSTAPTAAEDFSTGGARWSRKNATFLEANVQSATVALRHNSGFSGRVLHDVIFNGANGGSSRRNDTDEQTTATDVSAIASDRFAIGGSAHNGANNSAIDLHHLSLYPATLTAAEATKIRDYLNNRYNVY